ncbi:MAG: hypothetical protein GF408_01555, partial [Candidatus Omnitrophica bacterium]|nr:hypothetical protein [Candidatus Omnitrophota bacterium]
MYKLRKIKAISLAVLLAFTAQNISAANPDTISAKPGSSADNLAVFSSLQKVQVVDIKAKMALAEAAQELFSKRVIPEKAAEFIKDMPVITPDIRKRIDFASLRMEEGRLRIVYDSEKGKRELFLCRAGRQYGQGKADNPNALTISDIIIEEEELPGSGDITISSEGEGAVHEAPKDHRGILATGLMKKWRIRDKASPGVNDVIRKYWNNGTPRRKCREPGEKGAILSALFDMYGGDQAGYTFIDDDYGLYVYDIGRREFVNGITTHGGIRTKSIHITKEEYDRLMALGLSHLAARLAHEVTEIDAWRKKARELVERGEIGSEGETPAEGYGETWENGIRKWIRDNCDASMTGAAQEFAREAHRRALEIEAGLLAESILEDINDERSLSMSRAVIMGMLKGGHREILDDPYSFSFFNIEEEHKEIFLRVSKGVFHFDGPETRSFFLNILYARVSLELLRIPGGDMDKLFRDRGMKRKLGETDAKWRIRSLRKAVRDLGVLDDMSLIMMQKFVSDTRKRIRRFPPEAEKGLSAELDEILVSAREKNKKGTRLPAYGPDLEDIIISSTSPGETTEKISRTGRRTENLRGSDILGKETSDAIASSVVEQGGASGVLSTEAIKQLLVRYRNWNYMTLEEEAGGDGSMTFRTLAESPAEEYEYISRFKNRSRYFERVRHGADAVGELLSGNTREARALREELFGTAQAPG